MCFNNNSILGKGLVPVNAFTPPLPLCWCPFQGGDTVVVVESLFIVVPIVCGVVYLVLVLLFCTLLSSFAIILMGKRERERAGCFTLIVSLLSCAC